MVRSRSYIATPPGATIREQLKDRGMSQKEFAFRMDMSEKHISKLINGDVLLTPDVAVRLETVLGVPARFWSNLEAIYREKLVKAEAENAMEEDEIIARKFPYKEMSEYGWVPETKAIKERVVNLRRYFEVVKLDLLGEVQVNSIACRRLGITEKADLALMAWAQEAKIKARDIQTDPINIKKLIDSIPVFRKMTLEDPSKFWPATKDLLASCGIAIVLLPHLKGSFLHGATFLNGNKIVIGITARGKDADKFWFSLFHELAHVVLGHIGKAGGTSDKDEAEADRWAENALIDQKAFKDFRIKGDYTDRNVIAFARNMGIAPGIVVGRMQRERIIEYSMLNELKMQYEIVI